METTGGFFYLSAMLQFKTSDTAVNIVLTLSERLTITGAYYLFVFTSVTTKTVKTLILSDANDISTAKSRYNKFQINPSTLFLGGNTGEWHYNVYQQASSSNTDPALAGGLLESGKMYLDRSTDFAFTNYDSPVTYNAYNG